jgi:hypothetical protein
VFYEGKYRCIEENGWTKVSTILPAWYRYSKRNHLRMQVLATVLEKVQKWYTASDNKKVCP